jgi:hypothetical protein
MQRLIQTELFDQNLSGLLVRLIHHNGIHRTTRYHVQDGKNDHCHQENGGDNVQQSFDKELMKTHSAILVTSKKVDGRMPMPPTCVTLPIR